MQSLGDLFERKLRQQYYAETRLVDELDQVAENAKNDRLSEGMATHREETRQHVSRLESVFEEIRATPSPIEDAVIDGIIRERERLEDEIDDPDMLDLGYVVGGMAAERVEMTGYEGLLMIADQLGYDAAITDRLEANYEDEEAIYRELEAMSTASEMESFWDRITPS